jgi:hypothetical protein
MNPRATRAQAAGSHEVIVEFSNGETRKFDLRPLLGYEVFEKLQDSTFFAQVRAEHGTLVWQEGIDLDPDMVYLDSIPLKTLANA